MVEPAQILIDIQAISSEIVLGIVLDDWLLKLLKAVEAVGMPVCLNIST